MVDSDSEPLVFLLNDACMLSGEATHSYFIVFGFSRSGLKPTIYRIGGEHCNHYTTDAVIYENKHIYSLSMANIDNGCYNKGQCSFHFCGGRRGRYRIIVGLIITYAIIVRWNPAPVRCTRYNIGDQVCQ